MTEESKALGVDREGSTARAEVPAADQRGHRYLPNFREIRSEITGVVLPLGSMDAITRLARDLVAFGFGMGQAAPQSSEQLEWFNKSEAAKRDLLRNALARGTPAVEPSPAAFMKVLDLSGAV